MDENNAEKRAWEPFKILSPGKPVDWSLDGQSPGKHGQRFFTFQFFVRFFIFFFYHPLYFQLNSPIFYTQCQGNLIFGQELTIF